MFRTIKINQGFIINFSDFRRAIADLVKTDIFLEILGFFTKNNFLLLVNFVTPFRNPFSENDRFDLEFRSQILRN